MPPVGFEPTISAGRRPQTYALDRAATGTSTFQFSNVAKYGYGPPEDGSKGDRNMLGQILSVLV